jgi:predicted heme/steroid binding protein
MKKLNFRNGNKKTVRIVVIAMVLTLLPLLAFLIGYWQRSSRDLQASQVLAETTYAGLPTFKEADLAKYNGSDPNLPIYIGLNGLVYDVTAGRDYYKDGGSYHYLAGKDSSADLNLIGGDIIARKYPVIAKMVK